MALGGCYNVIKYLVIFMNLIFWVAGLAVLVISVWMLTDPAFYLNVAKDESSYYTGLYILLAAGALMFIIAFLGCCGAFRESSCMLVTFFCFLLVIMVAEIAAGIWGYTNRNELEKYVEESVLSTVHKEYGIEQSRTVTFDAIQKGLGCCGASGPSDWARSHYNKEKIRLMSSENPHHYKLPRSCCNSDSCDSEAIKVADTIPSTVYQEGCVNKLMDKLKEHMNILLIVGIVIVIMEALGLIFSIVLCCAIRNTGNYKA